MGVSRRSRMTSAALREPMACAGRSAGHPWPAFANARRAPPILGLPRGSRCPHRPSARSARPARPGRLPQRCAWIAAEPPRISAASAMHERAARAPDARRCRRSWGAAVRQQSRLRGERPAQAIVSLRAASEAGTAAPASRHGLQPSRLGFLPPRPCTSASRAAPMVLQNAGAAVALRHGSRRGFGASGRTGHRLAQRVARHEQLP